LPRPVVSSALFESRILNCFPYHTVRFPLPPSQTVLPSAPAASSSPFVIAAPDSDSPNVLQRVPSPATLSAPLSSRSHQCGQSSWNGSSGEDDRGGDGGFASGWDRWWWDGASAVAGAGSWCATRTASQESMVPAIVLRWPSVAVVCEEGSWARLGLRRASGQGSGMAALASARKSDARV
jgi:hypothetical protein